MKRMLLSIYVLALLVCAGSQVSAQMGGVAPGAGIGSGVLSGMGTAINPPRRQATRKILWHAYPTKAGRRSAAGRSSRQRSP
jgi:hypothetical protein